MALDQVINAAGFTVQVDTPAQAIHYTDNRYHACRIVTISDDGKQADVIWKDTGRRGTIAIDQIKGPRGRPVGSKNKTAIVVPTAVTVQATGAKKIMCQGIDFSGLYEGDIPEHLKHFVPKVDQNYVFPEWTVEALANLRDDGDFGRMPLMLVGHTGTGKTSWVCQVAARAGIPVFVVNMNQQTAISDFVGCYAVKAGETDWINGILPLAMTDGAWLVIDEMDYGEPGLLSPLNTVAVPGRQGRVLLKEKDGTTVFQNRNFMVFATSNTFGCMEEYAHLYPGANPGNCAQLDRYMIQEVKYLNEKQETKVLRSVCPKIETVSANRLIEIANTSRRAFEEHTFDQPFSTRRLLLWAHNIERYVGPDGTITAQIAIQAAGSTVLGKLTRKNREAFEGYIKRAFDHA